MIASLALAAPSHAEDAPKPQPTQAEPSLATQIRGGMMRRYERMNEALRQAEEVKDLEPKPAPVASIEDPTRPAPEFESSFREMMRGMRRGRGRRGVDANGGNAPSAPPVDNSRKKLKIELLATIKSPLNRPSALLRIEDGQPRQISEGGEVTVFVGDQNLTLRLEQFKGSELHLRVLPWDETIILR